MTEQEALAIQEADNDGWFYIFDVGYFSCAYGHGAFALARATGYTVHRLYRKAGDVFRVGFRAEMIEKVCQQLKEKGLKVETIDNRTRRFSGIDGTPDMAMVVDDDKKKEKVPEGNCSDYTYLKDLRKDLLAINVADCTPQEAIAHLRNLQIKCLAHMTI